MMNSNNNNNNNINNNNNNNYSNTMSCDGNTAHNFGSNTIKTESGSPTPFSVTTAGKSKTIKAPGSNTVRVSVACDRCRKKKIRCFYDDDNGKEGGSDCDNNHDNQQCANCKAVGLECIFTDKLARKAFPRGYTESLEERVRELEYENKKLQKMLSLKAVEDTKKLKEDRGRNSVEKGNNSQTSINSEVGVGVDNNNTNMALSSSDDTNSGDHMDVDAVKREPNGTTVQNFPDHDNANGAFNTLSATNVSRLDVEEKMSDPLTHDENCNCGMHHSVINRPVSIAGSVDVDRGDLSDDESLFSGDEYHENQIFNRRIADGVPGAHYQHHNKHGGHGNGHSMSNASSMRSERTDDAQKNRFVYNPNSFEQVSAPGAAAALSLQNKLRTKNFLNLANLIAASVPRSTEETLFIPTLLARIIKTHGFDSKAPYLTARSIALLKQAYNEENRYNLFPISFKGVNFNDLSKTDSKAFFQSLNLPNNMNLDICITIFFSTWNTIIPILNKEIFMANYERFTKSRNAKYEDGDLVGFEKFGELLVIITCLVMISTERGHIATKFTRSSLLDTINNESNGSSTGNGGAEGTKSPKDSKLSSNSEILQFYDHIIKQLIQSNMSSVASISSLQIITIELLYCLATDDLTTSYELRGRMITMSQQLRLHRCPAAVLGTNGSSVSKLQQGERRILFWCIYTLDSFSSFILGVPRLMKDYEIECALPSSAESASKDSDADASLITFRNNVQLSLVGKVSDSALSVMRYSKILGCVVDSIFKRSDGMKQTSINESKCLVMEDMLDTWRRNLPEKISFDKVYNSKDINSIDNLNETQLTLYYLYYQAKALIYMPLLANESSVKSGQSSKFSPAFITIQQATTSILTTMKVLNTDRHHYYFMPLPVNISRQMARFSLLAAKNSLEYTRGGSLFQEAKVLLTNIIQELKIGNRIGLLGCLSNNCVLCLENAIDAILSQPKGATNDKATSTSTSTSNCTPTQAPVPATVANSTNGLNGDGAESTRKDSRRMVGSPLKMTTSANGTDTDTGAGAGASGVEDEGLKSIMIGKKGDYVDGTMQEKPERIEIAINDIFSMKAPEYDRTQVKKEEDDNERTKEREESGRDDQLFKFMNEDHKAIEEESLNMLLMNDGDGSGAGEDRRSLERQQLLIQKKQQFLQQQQDSLQKHIQLLSAQRELNKSQMQTKRSELPVPPPLAPVAAPVQTTAPVSENVGTDVGFEAMGQFLQHSLNNSLSINDVPNNVKSFSDLLMLNDFGVDASMGLPFLDFELDTTQSKRQKTGYGEYGEYEQGVPDASFNPYQQQQQQKQGFRHGHEHHHRAHYAAAANSGNGGSDSRSVSPAAVPIMGAAAPAVQLPLPSESLSSLFGWDGQTPSPSSSSPSQSK
jgi:transcriptional regulatory protein CAT8